MILTSKFKFSFSFLNGCGFILRKYMNKREGEVKILISLSKLTGAWYVSEPLVNIIFAIDYIAREVWIDYLWSTSKEVGIMWGITIGNDIDMWITKKIAIFEFLMWKNVWLLYVKNKSGRGWGGWVCVYRVEVGTSLKIKWLVIKREFRFFTTNFKTPAYGNFT